MSRTYSPQLWRPPPLKGPGNNTFAPNEFGLVDPPGYTDAGDDAFNAEVLSQPSPPYSTAIPSTRGSAAPPTRWSTASTRYRLSRRAIDIIISIVDCLACGIQGDQVNNVSANKYADFSIDRVAADASVDGRVVRARQIQRAQNAGPRQPGLKRIVQLVR